MVRFFLETLIVRSRSEARLRAEVLALRHQLAVLERQVGRPHWQPTDRLVLAALSRVLPKAGLAIAPAQTRDSAPLASGIGPAQVGRLSATTPPAAAGGPERAARPHSQDGEEMKAGATGGSWASCASWATAVPTSPSATCSAAVAWSQHRGEARAPGASSCASTPTRCWPRTSSRWTRSG